MRAVLLSVLFLVACGKGDSPPPPSSGSPGAKPETGPAAGGTGAPTPAGDAMTEAKQLFVTTCSTCHGGDGKGDGPAAASLNPKPRNYTDAAWQASVTDDDIRKIILNGGAAVGKSPMMPAQAQLKDKPEVVTALVQIVRSFGAKQ